MPSMTGYDLLKEVKVYLFCLFLYNQESENVN